MENLVIEYNGNTNRHEYAAGNQIDIYLDYTNQDYESDNINKLIESVLEEARIQYLDICEDLKNEGYASYQSASSDEVLFEELHDREDVYYTENGKKINEN